MNFEERFSLFAQKEIKHLDLKMAENIFETLEKLKENPFPAIAKRCKDPKYQENIFEIGVENYRILYEILFRERIILIHRIEKIIL